MERDHYLTNEQLSKRFDSLFELVAYAIKLARYRVKSGREPLVRTSIKNPAFQTLREIEEGKDSQVVMVPLEEKTEEKAEV